MNQITQMRGEDGASRQNPICPIWFICGSNIRGFRGKLVIVL